MSTTSSTSPPRSDSFVLPRNRSGLFHRVPACPDVKADDGEQEAMKRHRHSHADESGQSSAPELHAATLFQDPSYFLLFRRLVVPLLRAHARPKLWIVGGSSQELYSYCILLEEEGLRSQCTIHVTSPDGSALARAQSATLPGASLQQHERDYREAGGRRRLESHFHARESSLELNPGLLDNVTFLVHDPARDGFFDEFHAISCRHALAGLDGGMQAQIHASLHVSLRLFGHLGLGSGESLPDSPHSKDYRSLSATEALYQRVR